MVKVTDSWLACLEFEPRISTAEDAPCIRGRCTLNMSMVKRPPIGVGVKRGGDSSGVVLIKSSRVIDYTPLPGYHPCHQTEFVNYKSVFTDILVCNSRVTFCFLMIKRPLDRSGWSWCWRLDAVEDSLYSGVDEQGATPGFKPTCVVWKFEQ
ncbi:hypothetical protein TNCV_1125361 [Trichonephila clavipes]|nr:hypothetical protein TNCV_1125361 [Trichonephila clavipes]